MFKYYKCIYYNNDDFKQSTFNPYLKWKNIGKCFTYTYGYYFVLHNSK